jgi:ABC-type bacteriocin/lantibiotic exporter with double-glycine peptidase domain
MGILYIGIFTLFAISIFVIVEILLRREQREFRRWKKEQKILVDQFNVSRETLHHVSRETTRAP